MQDDDEVPGGRSMDEDYILKQAFSALVPAFDPRPGRTNVPQIQDFHVPAPGSEDTASSSNQVPGGVTSSAAVKLALSIRVRPNFMCVDEEDELRLSKSCHVSNLD